MTIKERLFIEISRITGSEDIKIDYADSLEHGDYALNLALIEAKRQNRTPLEVAKELQDKFISDDRLTEIVEKVEVAGPGFINFYIRPQALFEEILSSKKDNTNKRKVVVEYSSPNIAKRFSVGHFRSTIIGQALYNLQKASGNEVLGLNHIGDWGTQFGVILAAIDDNQICKEDLSLDLLEKLYVDFSTKMKEDENSRDKARSWFKKLEDGDLQARELWSQIKDISLKEFERIYQELGVHVDEVRGESFYEDKMPEIISEAKSLNISQEGERGALIIELDNMPPAMLVKSDGTSTYFTRDLAAIKYRVQVDKADLIIYEVGSEQTLHFRQVFASARKFDWGKKVELVHIPHGLIRLPEGKMSTRKGNTIKLEELIEESYQKSRDLNSDNDVYKKVAIGALKYNDLKRSPEIGITFDWQEVLNMQGNSGPYLQYTFARTQSILSKSKNDGEVALEAISSDERVLMVELSRFNEIIAKANENYSPNTLCNYLYELAQSFNGFYAKEKIIDGDREELKLFLTKKVGEVMKNGLELLGIEAPTKM